MGGNSDAGRIRVGWQGIEVEVPKGWELSAYGGAAENGHFELDDGIRPRFRLWWQRGRHRTTAPQESIDRYRRSLMKHRGDISKFEVLPAESLPFRCRKDKDTAVYRYEGAAAAYGAAWYCRTCGCVGLAEVRSDRPPDKTLRWVLASIADHRDDGQRLWAVYDFAFLAPDTYNLERAELMPGRLSFPMRRSRQCLLTVERWGVAREWLKKSALEGWPGELAKRLKRAELGPVRQDRFSFRGHEAWGFRQADSRRGRWRPWPPLDGMVWHCPDDDKVYAVFGQGTEKELVRQVAETIGCG